MTTALLARFIRQIHLPTKGPLASMFLALLAVVWPTLGLAQSMNDPVFELEDQGQRRRFVLACDELSCTPKETGKAHTLAIAEVEDGESVKAKALELQASSGERLDLVLYEVGKPRTIASRRVLTRKVIVNVKAPFDRDRLIAAFPAQTSKKPSYAQNIVLLTLTNPGESLTALAEIRKIPGVVSAMPLLARQQSKKLIPNDPLFSNDPNKNGYQWHLQNTGDRDGVTGVDANVVSVWDSYRGSGIVIGIIDDGLEVAHPDLAANVDTANDHDWNDATPDDPTGDPSFDDHGTACAGVAGARGNNAIGGSGAAPEATLVGLRLIAASNTDADEAEALGWMPEHIDITSNSWGPSDLPDNLSGPGFLTQTSLRNTATIGRGGLGTLHFWAAGNGGNRGDNSNYDGYANSIYTIAVGASGDYGERAGYSEPGANMLISAPSNGNGQGITTTTTFGDYTYSFGGTSSATPLAAGVAALMLNANPNLGWRDVQEILIRSARQIDPTHSDWTTNGAGFHFNHSYGAGLIDAAAAVALANSWSALTTQRSQVISLDHLDESIPDNNATGITKSFQVEAGDSLRVEHVTVTLTTPHDSRGDLKVVLQSPAGTESILALPRSDTNSGYADWTFMSVRNWGESSQGTWQFTVSDEQASGTGDLDSLALTIYGTDEVPPSAAPIVVSESASAQTGSSFIYHINASNRPTTYGATGLPAGLELNATSGLISGVPEVSGTFTIGLTASNSLGSASGQLSLTIDSSDLEPPLIVSPLMVTATVGLPFDYQIEATNEPEIYEAQNLPSGLELETSSGVIFGSPEIYGNYTSTIRAINEAGEVSAFLEFIVTRPAGPSFSHAVDNRRPFYLGGSEVWFPQTAVTDDGVDALQSPSLGEGKSSSFGTDVVGPATVHFEWKVSSEEDYDRLKFSIDDTIIHEISGDQDWARIEYDIPEGAHRLKWAYSKDGSIDQHLDTAWVDSIFIFSDLSSALNNYIMAIDTHGDEDWFGQSATAHDSLYAAQSPPMVDSRTGTLKATTFGPGMLTFHWKVSSEVDYDELRLLVDGTEIEAISGEQDWEQRAVYLTEGLHSIEWQYRKDSSISAGQDAGWVDELQLHVDAPSYESAADSENLHWESRGDAVWTAQSTAGQFGSYALQSGIIGDNESSILETAVTGPGTLSFFWKVSSESSYDSLRVSLNGEQQDLITGETNWSNRTLSIPAGTHTVRWDYSKNGNNSAGEDAAWIDLVAFTTAEASSVPLGEAIDLEQLDWTTSVIPWVGQDIVSYDGFDSAVADNLSDNQSATIETTITGPATMVFYWKVSSEPEFDFLQFAIDGEAQERISGEIDWAPMVADFGPGEHTVQWQYSKDHSVSQGDDSSWIDLVSVSFSEGLGQALDAESLTWNTSGQRFWYPQTDTTQDGQDSAAIGNLGEEELSYIETTVTGPGSLSFYWMTMGDADEDTLSFTADNIFVTAISNNPTWEHVEVDIGPGEQVLFWTYSEGSGPLRGSAYVDQVQFVPDTAGSINVSHTAGSYAPGGHLPVSVNINYEDLLISSLGYEMQLPAGWSYVSDNSSALKPSLGNTGLLEWAWFTIPDDAIPPFEIVLQSPADLSDPASFSGTALLRDPTSNETRVEALPNPLTVTPMANHSADSNGDTQIDLSELFGVISLYNYSEGNSRLGSYQFNSHSSTYLPGIGLVTGTPHSTDTNADWLINLSELLGTISIYNYREDTSRLGTYHYNTSLGRFVPGPAGEISGSSEARAAKGLIATFANETGTFDPSGGVMTFSSTVEGLADSVSAFGFEVTLDEGWNFVSSTTDSFGKPLAGSTNRLEWFWLTHPSTPLSFDVTLKYPAGLGDFTLAGNFIENHISGISNTTPVTIDLTSAAPNAFDLWASAALPSNLPPEERVKTADPDADGLSNLFERALGLDPISGANGSEELVSLEESTDSLHVSFMRPDGGVLGIDYYIGTSGNLTYWDDTLETAENCVVESQGDGTEKVTMTVPLPSGKRSFARLTISETGSL